MRMIGQFENEKSVRAFSAFLTTKGIHNQVDRESDGPWLVWVYDEEHVDAGKKLLSQYHDNPEDPRYSRALSEAEEQHRQRQKREESFHKKVYNSERLRWNVWRLHPVTVVLITISVVLTLLSGMGRDPTVYSPFYITVASGAAGIRSPRFLVEVLHGQVWRLVTPIFLHFGFFHLLFDMLWLYDLGAAIERVEGSLYFGLLTLGIAICSNLGQYLAVGPLFGGMSGVVYGLFGFIWMRSKFDPWSNYRMPQQLVVLMIVWFVVCTLGFFGPIANWAHGVGLATGGLWGWLSASRK